jgi:hypothetical protein
MTAFSVKQLYLTNGSVFSQSLLGAFSNTYIYYFTCFTVVLELSDLTIKNKYFESLQKSEFPRIIGTRWCSIPTHYPWQYSRAGPRVVNGSPVPYLYPTCTHTPQWDEILTKFWRNFRFPVITGYNRSWPVRAISRNCCNRNRWSAKLA